MASPTFVDCPADQWTKVATNVTTGMLHKVYSSGATSPTVKYLQTFVQPTAGSAPTGGRADGVSVFEDSEHVPMSFSTGTDVYIYPIGSAGRVRVDVP
jgi:hypothetical protein